MSYPYVCTTCQLRCLLRKQTQILYRQRQRQWLSNTAQKPKNASALAESESRGSSRVRGRPKSELRDDPPRGRYSGKPLAPQALLDQLEKSAPASRTSNQLSSAGQDHEQHHDKHAKTWPPRERPEYFEIAESKRPPSISPSLWHQYQLFFHASHSLHNHLPDDRRAVKILWTIARTPNHEELKYLTRLPEFKRRCFWLARRVSTEWTTALAMDESTARAIARPVEALAAMTACTLHNRSIYPSSLWQVATVAAQLSTNVSSGSETGFLTCIRELLELWNLSMRAALVPQTYIFSELVAKVDWSFLPDRVTLSEDLQHERRVRGVKRFSFGRALNMLVPEVTVDPKQAAALRSEGSEVFDYPSAALVTLDLIHQMQTQPDRSEVVKEFEPWMLLMDIMLKSTGDTTVPPALAQKLMTSDHAEYYKSVIARLGLQGATFQKSADSPYRSAASVHKGHGLETDAASLIGAMSQELPPSQSTRQSASTGKQNPADHFVTTCLKRLGRALEQKGLNGTLEVFGDVQRFASRNPKSQFPIELYESLLYSFLSFRDSQTTVAVWNDMIRAGHRPTTKTYTIMMRGSQGVRDQSAIEGFWNKMRQAGLKPDHNAWTTRIFGMLKSRLPAAVAFKALDEMGQEWIAAARAAYAKQTALKGKNNEKAMAGVQTSELLARFAGDVDGVPRPDVTVMNSAISALAAKQENLIPKALSWGRLYGIEPDLTTSNVLINISMRRGLPAEGLGILRRMSEKGVEPNSTTWTVLLSAMFEGNLLDDETPEVVEKRVLDFVRSIDDMAGSDLDEKGYALIVDRFLKKYDNPSGAQKVLERMATKGMKPNVHLYSILMTSYFQQSPPNFAAVEALWARIQSENSGYGAVLDTIFYDRMIEAYAQNHATVGTQTMLDFLERMEKQGKRPSWRALEYIVRALAEAGSWNKLEQIVERVRRGSEGGPQENGFGSREFWRFVESIGMVRHDNISKQESSLEL